MSVPGRHNKQGRCSAAPALPLLSVFSWRPLGQLGAGLAGVPADEIADQAGAVAALSRRGALEPVPQGILHAHRAPRVPLARHSRKGVMPLSFRGSDGCHVTHANVGVMSPRSRHGEPRLAAAASWLVLAASFGLSAATWIALAELAGFTGRVAGVFPLAWLMPATVDGYVVVALVLWMSPVPARVARHARAHTYAAGSIGVAAQSAYHCLTVLTTTGTIWRAVLAAAVGAIPPAAAAFSVHMRALGRRESRTVEPVTEPAKITVLVPTSPTPPPTPTAPEAVQDQPDTATDTATDTRAEDQQVTAPTPTDTPTDNRPTRRPPEVNQSAATALAAGGWTPPKIADLLGVSERTVRRALRSATTAEPELVGATNGRATAATSPASVARPTVGE